MKKRLSALILAMLILIFSAVAEGNETGLEDAQAVADELIGGDYQAVVDRFDDTMKELLDAEALKNAWDSTVYPLGNWQEMVEVRSEEINGLFVVTITERFENGGLNIIVAYDGALKVAGLQLTYADLPYERSDDEGQKSYEELEVTIAAEEDLPLEGILTLPEGAEKPPVVILVQGSGSSNRDEQIYSNAPFADIAHGLADMGVATLRYDKRFYTYPEAATLENMNLRAEILDDLEYAIDLVKEDQRVNGDEIYVLGHSLGGMLVPAIAVENPEVKGLISLAGSLRPLWEIVYDQNMAMLEDIDFTELSDEERATIDDQIEQLNADMEVLRGDLNSIDDGEMILGIPGIYWKSLGEYCGMNFISDVKQPLLILQGSADFQVYADKDYPLWQEELAGRDDVTFHLYDGLNHLFMETNGKSDITEYAVKSSVDTEVIEDIAEFVLGG